MKEGTVGSLIKRVISHLGQSQILRRSVFVGELRGVPVRCFPGPVDVNTCNGLERGVELILRRRPDIWAHFRRDVKTILIRPGHDAECWLRSQTVVIDSGLLSLKGAASVGAALVHEATHARIHARGIPHDSRIMQRIEDIGVQRQIRFMRSLSDEYQGTELYIAELVVNARDKTLQGHWLNRNHRLIAAAMTTR